MGSVRTRAAEAEKPLVLGRAGVRVEGSTRTAAPGGPVLDNKWRSKRHPLTPHSVSQAEFHGM
jgi:hypothetical protein